MTSSPNPAGTGTAHILVVDDEPDLRTLYELALLREGYRVETAGSVGEARQQLGERRFDAIITDMRLPDGLGLELLHELQAGQRGERCVVMTAYGSAENAVEALKAGAFDYLTKPVDLRQFRAVVASAVQETSRPVRAPAAADTVHATPLAVHSLPDEALARPALARMVGESQTMRSVKSRISRVARSMAPVLIRGESGTGKELAARAVHACSHRADGPFVAVNCGAIPEALLEAEFFGARKGSYTGATHDREGFFHAAQGGTLFLDEIGDLPLAMQSKLLRAIQERSVRPLGATQEESVDVRIVSATHRDLASDVREGRFRQDLFYRLNVIEIALPPLRDRRDDLPALCDALLGRIAHESSMPIPRLGPALMAQLAAHPLHGNVRELENLLHRAVALSEGDELQVDLLHGEAPAALPADRPAAVAGAAAAPAAGVALPEDLQGYLDQQEREIIVRALHETGFNRTAAAARLGLSLRQMRYRIARLAIAVPGSDEPGEMTADEADGDAASR
ncbi:MAG: sigma-54-dependent Fis family transcriptional regulator [Burkholderiaceae bacterium]|nr:sigma-54-dependent Fis family transcriptional regulator [Burkholderiaceae bacterium]